MDAQDLVEEVQATQPEENSPIEIPVPENFEKLFDQSEKEIQDYIIALEEKYRTAKIDIKVAQKQTEKAYESKRALAQQYENYRVVTEQKLMFVQSAINNIHQAMRLIGGNH